MNFRCLLWTGLILVLLMACTGPVSAQEIVIDSANDVEQGTSAPVGVYVRGASSLDAFDIRVAYDASVMSVSRNGTFDPDDWSITYGFSTPGLAKVVGYANMRASNITGDSPLFGLDCTALKNDGSSTTLNLTIIDIEESRVPVYTYTTVNGTFTTLDEVAPNIIITSPADGATVPQDVAVTATITDVGGVDQSSISITVGGVAITSPTITPITGGCTVSGTATNVPLGARTVVVSASDTSGNHASATHSITVAESGITFDPNLDDTFTNETQPVISARYVEVTGVRMFLDGTDVTANTTTPSSGVITLDYSSYGLLADGVHTVVVNGTSTIDSSVLSATETFTKDTVLPVVVVTGISDSDGDGYPEASENLNIAYTVTDANAERVWIGSASSTTFPSGTLVYGSAQGNTLGNRNATLTAVDKAGNSNTSSPFHIYNNYLAYINESSAGTFAGLDLTKTAAYNVFTSEVAQAISISGGAGQMNLPTLGTLQKRVTAGSGVVVDNRANDTIPAGTFPTGAPYFVAPSGGTLNFAINVPNIDNATIIIGMANSSFVDQVLRGGSSSVSTSSLEQALSKEKIVIYGKGGGSYGYKFVRITGSTATDLGGRGGFTFNTDLPTMIRANSYDLSAGFNTVTHGLGLPIGYGQTQLGPGEYVIMAITLDNDRVAAITAMPFVVTEEASQFSTSAGMYSLGDPVVVNWGGAAPQNAAAVLIREGSTYTGNVTLDLTTLGTGSLQSMYLLGDGNETVKILYSGANVWISEGYGNAARAANAATLNIPTSDLLSGTYRVHMLAENGGNLTAYGSTSVQLFAGPVPTPTPQPTTPPSGGGGGGRGGFAPETGSSSLLIGSEGKLLRPYTIRSPSGIAELYLPLGTYAVDADGNPLSEVSIDDLDPADLPAVPAGAAYTFAGHAVVCSPSGARFDPAISLVFTFNADQWSEIMQAAEYDASSLVVKWYDEEAGEWETVPTVVDPATRTVTASVEHFTVFGLFVEPGAVTPVVTPTTPIVTPTTPTTTTPVTPPAEGFPWTYVVIAVVIILVIAVGVYYYTRKP